MSYVLRNGNAEMKLKAIDILHSSMAQDPSALRGHICSFSKSTRLKRLLDNQVNGPVEPRSDKGLTGAI